MRIATRALGKTALRDVSAGDLFATDEEAANISGLPLGFLSPQEAGIDCEQAICRPHPR